MTRKTKPFWQIEMTVENYLKVHQCYDLPYSGIDVIFDCCKIDLITLYNLSDKNTLGRFGDDGKEKFIAHNVDLSLEQILFTKAHELGHFALHHNLKRNFSLKKLMQNQNKKTHKKQKLMYLQQLFLCLKS